MFQNAIKDAVNQAIAEALGAAPKGDFEPRGDIFPWVIGKNYLIRTVTMHHIGKLEAVTKQELVLSGASWVADSGRFHDALKEGKLDEVEPFVHDVIVGRGALIDATEWPHDLVREQK